MTWKKSTHSGADGCVEIELNLPATQAPVPAPEVTVEHAEGGVWVSQSNDPRVKLWFNDHEWDVFLRGAKDHEFDLEEAA